MFFVESCHGRVEVGHGVLESPDEAGLVRQRVPHLLHFRTAEVAFLCFAVTYHTNQSNLTFQSNIDTDLTVST